MIDYLLGHEPAIRLAAFSGVFALMAFWEVRAPCRPLKISKMTRWSANLGLVALNTLLVRFLFPTAVVGVAVMAEERSWGLLNTFSVPAPVAIIGSVVFLDLAIYLQHILFHAAPTLWRLHRTHHTDRDYDVTTGARFHPIEIVLSMLIKLGVASAIGAPPVAVLLFEIILNTAAMFNHSNISLPAPLEPLLRLFIVTPGMHRVHHSIIPDEANSNFGFNLSCWDRIFGTYRAEPRGGERSMIIGINAFEGEEWHRLSKLLTIPFRSSAPGYALNEKGMDRGKTPDATEGE